MIVKLLTEHHFGVSKLNRRLQGLVRVYTCQNVRLLEITCHGSIVLYKIHILRTCRDLIYLEGFICQVIIQGSVYENNAYYIDVK